MTIFELLILLIIAAICGSIGAKLAGSSSKGCIANIVLGFIGAIIGRWLSPKLGIPTILEIQGIPIVWSIIGATLFVAVISFITGGNSDKKKK